MEKDIEEKLFNSLSQEEFDMNQFINSSSVPTPKKMAKDSESNPKVEYFGSNNNAAQSSPYQTRNKESKTQAFADIPTPWKNPSFVNISAPTGPNSSMEKYPDLRNTLNNMQALPHKTDVKLSYSPNISWSNIPREVSTTVHTSTKRLDLTTAKAALSDICGKVTAMDEFFNETSAFLFRYLTATIGGVFVKQKIPQYTQSGPPTTLSEWKLQNEYPSQTIFKTLFNYNNENYLLEKASVEKRCFCVTTDLSNRNGSLSYIFMPIPTHDSADALVIYFYGALLSGEKDVQEYVNFFEVLRKPMSFWMKSLICAHQNKTLIQKIDQLLKEREDQMNTIKLQQAVVSVLESLNGPETSDVVVLCTDTEGGITYISPQIEHFMGYLPSELVGMHSVLVLHQAEEIALRAQHVQSQMGEQVLPGFKVLVLKTLITKQEDSNLWQWIKKDGRTHIVNITTKPLIDDISILGFVMVVRFFRDEH